MMGLTLVISVVVLVVVFDSLPILAVVRVGSRGGGE